jgi:hypothetical protein
MTYKYILAYCLIIPALLIAFSSCNDSTTSAPITDSLDPISEVSLIPGAENSTIIINRSSVTYFSLEFMNISSNKIVDNDIREGWCIDWQKPIDSNGGIYTNIPLYSTFNVEKWNPLNFLLNIKEQLKADDPDITQLEIQVVIWSLRGYPKFDLDSINIEDMPGRLHNNGVPTFSAEKVKEILQIVENGHKDFAFIPGTKFAVIAELPVDVQTVITVAR